MHIDFRKERLCFPFMDYKCVIIRLVLVLSFRQDMYCQFSLFGKMGSGGFASNIERILLNPLFPLLRGVILIREGDGDLVPSRVRSSSEGAYPRYASSSDGARDVMTSGSASRIAS